RGCPAPVSYGMIRTAVRRDRAPELPAHRRGMRRRASRPQRTSEPKSVGMLTWRDDERIGKIRHMKLAAVGIASFFAAASVACSRATPAPALPLVRATTTMMTAWQVPLDPKSDASLTDPRMAEQIRWGFRIFVNTPAEAPQFAGGSVSCNNCHLNAGQRERSLALVGIAGMFPEHNNRAARLISLPDRVVDCFLRSENATGRDDEHPPTTASKEVLAVTSYLTWLSRGYGVGQNPS